MPNHQPLFASPSLEKQAAKLATLAVRALYYELALYPKPGLVSFVDSGSHQDMNAQTFIRSLFSLRRYFYEIACAAYHHADFSILKDLGIAAEQRMLQATGGINTHRGAIFILGLFIAGIASCQFEYPADLAFIPLHIQQKWGRALTEHTGAPHSHGKEVLRKFKASGARGEALAGFPAIFNLGLPALKTARRNGASLQQSYLSCFFHLLAEVKDTNILYRSGQEGLAFVQRAARQFLTQGGITAPDYLVHAKKIHQQCVKRNISPGGTADLLAACILLSQWEDARWL